MTLLLNVAALVFGAVLGSFATVLVARIPGGEGIGGRSKCRHCGAQILPRDNVPLLSWMLLRGRCRHCGVSISWRYPAVEVATALLFLLIVNEGHSLLVTIAWLLFTPIAVALAFIDLEHKRLPDVLTLSSFVCVMAVLTADAAFTGQWQPLRTAFFAALALSAFYLLLNVVSRGGMGMGDVKMALVLGALTGYLGWLHVITASFVAFIAGSAVGVLLMVLGRAGRKSAIPFGPFMLLGLYVSLAATRPLVDWYLQV